MSPAGLREDLDPQVWTIPWHVHRQATPHGHPSCTSLAPEGFQGALSPSRSVSLTHRTVPCTSRTPGSARKRPPHLDASALSRRFLQHVLPDGFRPVRHCGFLHASWAISPDTMRLLIVKRHPLGVQTPPVEAPAPLVAACPPCGTPLHLGMRLWTANRVWLATG